MPFWVYILQSESSERYYCGQTNNLSLRIDEHNEPNYKGTKTTKRFKGPWQIVWKRECSSRSSAMKLEKSIKKRGIDRYLKENDKLIDNVSGC
ncbi:MAG: GIY-YIG nuclease family protein [Desulfobacterales bacterium]|nr:GIY-YIG nuclease family protein [Desulfobacterales bacterium]